MNDSILSQTPPLLDAGSPPPKCAICLGACSNKCFSDSCMHEFCFSCLTEWSKVKAECPLCKKPFKSILHNIKSNDEYEEYIVADAVPPQYMDMEGPNYIYLPPLPSRHFQFRTTFTVDPDGEFAIQQMLLSHPLTNNGYNFTLYPRLRSRLNRMRSVNSSTSFRRSIYALNYWVASIPDLAGRYRDIHPSHYRANPSARNRLVPWLNRELNALLRENTQQVMNLVDIIMEHLPRWHIRSRSFRNLLLTYLNDRTDHFLHEFYNFMRSPHNMIDYDRFTTYGEQPTPYTYIISDYEEDENDSDVAIVNVTAPFIVENNSFSEPTLEIIDPTSVEVIEIDSDSSHDSDVMIRDAPVEVVDLLQSDSDEENRIGGVTPNFPFRRRQRSPSTERLTKQPLLPLKMRLKRKHQLRETSARKKKKAAKRYSSCSTCESSSESDDSSSGSSTSSSSSAVRHKSKKWRKYKKSKSRNYKEYKKTNKDKYKSHKYKKAESSTSSSSTTTTSATSTSSSSIAILPKKRTTTMFDSDDNIPLSKIRNKEMKDKNNVWKTDLTPPIERYPYALPTFQGANYYSTRICPDYTEIPLTTTSGYSERSFTPPVVGNSNNSKCNYYQEGGVKRPPVCINIGVGTSPRSSNVDSDGYVSCVGSGCIGCNSGNNSVGVQTVLVKNERVLVPSNCPIYSSDSNN